MPCLAPNNRPLPPHVNVTKAAYKRWWASHEDARGDAAAIRNGTLTFYTDACLYNVTLEDIRAKYAYVSILPYIYRSLQTCDKQK